MYHNANYYNNKINHSDYEIKPFVLTNIVKKYTNLENEKKRKIRELKDASTKCFVNIFFDSNDILLKFVFWVYHKINCRLEKIQQQYCKADEKIIFFFKGGNIMFLWRKRFEEIFGSANENITSKTSISDCDFAIYILTKEERRFNDIYSQINSILVIELEEIGAMFDELFIKAYSNTRNNSNNKKNSNMINKDFACEKFKKNEKKIFNNFFRDFYTKDKIEKYLVDTKIELEKLKGSNNNFYEEKNYEIYKYNIPDDYSIDFNIRQSLILRPEDKVPDSFSLTNFSNRKLHYVTVNANIFNNIAKAGHLIGFDLYRIKFNTIIDNILKSKKNDPNTNENNFNGPKQQLNFGIPSEFIDISVSKYYDLNLQKLREDFYNGQNKNNLLKNKFALIGGRFTDGSTLPQSILTMQIKYIVDDLLVTLFSQNQHNPMIDAKYEKRLFRIFFFYIGNNLVNNKEILPKDIFDAIDSNKKNTHDYFYDFFLSPRDNLDINYIINMKGKHIYNFFNIKNKFDELEYLIQFTILFNKIIDYDEILSGFIVYYNNIYNIRDNNNLSEFKAKFKKFKNDLNVNYRKAYDYFIKISDSVVMFSGGGKDGNENGKNNSETPISQKKTPTAAKRSNTSSANILNNKGAISQNATSIAIHRSNSISANILNYTGNSTNRMNNKKIVNELLFNIGGVMLEYKDIDLPIGYEERKFYPSFEFDDDM